MIWGAYQCRKSGMWVSEQIGGKKRGEERAYDGVLEGRSGRCGNTLIPVTP